MSHFFRLVDDHVVDFFVQKAEGICYSIDQLLDGTPYLLSCGYLKCFSTHFTEERSDGFIAGKTSCHGKEVVLDAAYCGCGNLGGKRVALALPKSQIGLAVLEKLM